MSVLNDFESMRRYRKRAAEFEQLADACLVANVRHRYRVIAHHYAELVDSLERCDKVRVTQSLEALREIRKANGQRGAHHAVENDPSHDGSLLPGGAKTVDKRPSRQVGKNENALPDVTSNRAERG